MCQKGFYPYEWVGSREKYSEWGPTNRCVRFNIETHILFDDTKENLSRVASIFNQKGEKTPYSSGNARRRDWSPTNDNQERKQQILRFNTRISQKNRCSDDFKHFF